MSDKTLYFVSEFNFSLIEFKFNLNMLWLIYDKSNVIGLRVGDVTIITITNLTNHEQY